MKTRLITLSVILVTTISIIVTLLIPKTKMFLGVYDANSGMRKTDQINKSPYAIFGDSSRTLMTKNERTSNHTLEIVNTIKGERTFKLELNAQTGKIRLFDKTGIVISELLLEPEQLTRFVSVDRFAEKYYDLTPYHYGANNPILNMDINGDSIWVYYGNNQRTLYTPGAKYDGDDGFVCNVFQQLNQMNGSDIGNTILSQLSGSDNNFDYKNSFPTDNNGNIVKNGLSFVANKNGGGTINAGFLNEQSGNNPLATDFNKMRSLAHESFHGFQSEFGERGRESYLEVSAELVERAVVGYIWPFGNGKGKTVDQSYQNAMDKMMFSSTLNQSVFNRATQSFLQGSNLNSSGIYTKLGYKSNLRKNPVVSRLFPLIP